MYISETRLIKQPVSESQHLRPGIHPRVQQKIVRGDEKEDPGNARVNDILDEPHRFERLCAKGIKDRRHELLQDKGEIEDH